MTKKDIVELIQEINKGKSIEYMTIQEMRETMIALTGMVVGLLLASNKSAAEIKEIIKE